MNTINKINDMKGSDYSGIDFYDQEEIDIDDMNEDEWLDYVVEGERVVEPYQDRLDRDNKKRLDMGNRLGMSDTTMKILSKEGYDRIRVSDLCVVGEDKYRLTLLHGGVVQVDGRELDRYDLRSVEDSLLYNSIDVMEVSY